MLKANTNVKVKVKPFNRINQKQKLYLKSKNEKIENI